MKRGQALDFTFIEGKLFDRPARWKEAQNKL